MCVRGVGVIVRVVIMAIVNFNAVLMLMRLREA